MASALAASAEGADAARLYALVARNRRRAVVFRRGPSNQVRLLAWELDSDTVMGGQWLRGWIFGRRCDLSPDGEMLAYFAAFRRPSWRSPYRLCTAISRPPYLNALALWPKWDTWGGGGLFTRPDLLELNHAPDPDGTIPLGKGFQLPSGLAACPMGPHSGPGANTEIEVRRLRRDGWTIEWSDSPVWGLSRAGLGAPLDPPFLSHRPVGEGATLRVSYHSLHGEQGRDEVRTAVIKQGTVQRDLGRVDWADADHTGDVLYAANGCLYRIATPNLVENEAILVADLNGMTIEPMKAVPGVSENWGGVL